MYIVGDCMAGYPTAEYTVDGAIQVLRNNHVEKSVSSLKNDVYVVLPSDIE
jgi:hypothetical protein